MLIGKTCPYIPASDRNLPSTAQHQYPPSHIHYVGNSVGTLKGEGECQYMTRACRSFQLSTRKVPYWTRGVPSLF